MLQFLRIENFLHVLQADVSFGEGLHCITGESGAGKTVILKALKLLLGEKPPQNSVHDDADCATIEAAFNIENQRQIHEILDDAGILFDKEEWLLIKRIIPKDGRSRLFINSQNANILILERLGAQLVEIVDQHAGKQLLSSEYQRRLLDTFGQHKKILERYTNAYTTYLAHIAKLHQLEHNEPESLENLVWQQEELEKHNVHTLNIEEQLLLHEKYSHAEEIAESLSQVVVTLKERITNELHSMSRLVEKCSEKDASLAPLTSHLQTAMLEIDEAATLGEQYLDSLNFDAEEFSRLEELTHFLSTFKRKHGISYEDINESYQNIVERIALVQDREKLIDTQKSLIKEAERVLEKAANELTAARENASKTLSTLTSKTLQMLRMEDACFEIALSKEEWKKTGQDVVSFDLVRGKNRSSIRQVASGGELSRILLAIKAHIATKQSTPTLIFDEIDSNIGGETANVVADLLRQAAEAQQLLTITHFPQVAAKADHHIVVKKTNATASITLLPDSMKKAELLRMVGGKESVSLLT